MNLKGVHQRLNLRVYIITGRKTQEALAHLENNWIRLNPRPAITKRADIRVNRNTYANIISNIDNNRLLFIDETRFNLHTHAKYRYILPGQAAHYMVPANRRKMFYW